MRRPSTTPQSAQARAGETPRTSVLARRHARYQAACDEAAVKNASSANAPRGGNGQPANPQHRAPLHRPLSMAIRLASAYWPLKRVDQAECPRSAVGSSLAWHREAELLQLLMLPRRCSIRNGARSTFAGRREAARPAAFRRLDRSGRSVSSAEHRYPDPHRRLRFRLISVRALIGGNGTVAGSRAGGGFQERIQIAPGVRRALPGARTAGCSSRMT
jgi:hypothetical protein